MRKHRTAARWFAGLLLGGIAALGAVAPAQAAVGWHGTTVQGSYHIRPADTGWNGT